MLTFLQKKTSPEIETIVTDDIISDVRIISRETEPEEATIDFSSAVNDEQVDPVDFNDKSLDNDVQFNEQRETLIEEIEAIEEVENNEEDPIVEAAMIEEDEAVVQPQDLFIFNAVAKEGAQLGGHELLQFFLTSGFRFGEMSIFHRHEHSDGTGPILFSIANMMAPGVFDPDNMEQFKSEGVSFFLTAPNADIDVKASFEMMLRAVEQMAEEFDCIVLNAQREPMTEEQFIEYNHRLLHYI